MNKIIKILLPYLLLTIVFLPNKLVRAEGEGLPVYLFYLSTCPHCHEETGFLQRLSLEKNIQVRAFEVSNRINENLWREVGDKLKVIDLGEVPFTVVGDKYFVGYSSDGGTGTQINQAVDLCLAKNNCPDLVGDIIASKNNQMSSTNVSEIDTDSTINNNEPKNSPDTFFLALIILFSIILTVTFVVGIYKKSHGHNPTKQK